MSGKLVPKIILEGTRLTHKTDLAFKLNDHPQVVGERKYRYHSPIISAEWCAFTNFPWGRGLINFEAQEEHLAFETYHTWARMFELQRYYSWIIDRFHISTQVYQYRQRGIRYDFTWLEQRLMPLGFCLVFLYRTSDSFAAAREKRLQVSGKPSQYDDLQQFVDDQETMRDFIRSSQLPLLEIDISDDNIDRVAAGIALWLKETGHLYLDQ